MAPNNSGKDRLSLIYLAVSIEAQRREIQQPRLRARVKEQAKAP
jgi:hypothetical protein